MAALREDGTTAELASRLRFGVRTKFTRGRKRSRMELANFLRAGKNNLSPAGGADATKLAELRLEDRRADGGWFDKLTMRAIFFKKGLGREPDRKTCNDRAPASAVLDRSAMRVAENAALDVVLHTKVGPLRQA